MQSTLLRVNQILSDVMGVDVDEVLPEYNLFSDLQLDSLDILDVLFRVEREFNIQLPENEFVKPEEATVGFLVQKIEGRLPVGA